MLPRESSSIFYIGDDESNEASNELGRAKGEVSSSRRRPENVVGLRLVMHRTRREARVVMKSEIKPWVLPESNARQHHKSFPQLGFLKACFLCHKELSLQKDVFVYKGEQGFCSAECRRHQMAVDERRERGVPTKQRSKANHFTRLNARASDHQRRISAAA